MNDAASDQPLDPVANRVDLLWSAGLLSAVLGIFIATLAAGLPGRASGFETNPRPIPKSTARASAAAVT